jgi:hypothetical protein
MTACAKLENDRAAQAVEFVLVPRVPTKEMLEAAWAEAVGEDAAGVWREMIAEWEGFTATRTLQVATADCLPSDSA